MDLIQNEENNKKDKQTKSIMKLIIALIVVLLIICIGLIGAIYYIQITMMKLTVDGIEISTFSEDLFVREDNTIYVSIRDFAKLVGYTVYNGDHSSESNDKGYLQTTNEEAFYEINSNKIYKVSLKGGDKENFNLQNPVKMINNKPYMSIEGMQISVSCAIAYNQNNNQYSVYTLPTLVTRYSKTLKNLTISTDFNNQKAIIYGMIVVQNTQSKYGVIGLDGKEIVGTKYSNIEFVENSNDFIVTTDDKKVGILSSKGTTKIPANYDEIKQIDKDLNIYLAKNNNKYGVINQNGNTVIYLEYDAIGFDTTIYTNNSERKQYLFFENCIPVQRDKKWGMYDVTGKQIIEVEYDSLGCNVGAVNKTTNAVLTIDEYDAIVVTKDKKYGLVDKTGKTLIPCVLDSIYSITISGEKTYYVLQGEVETKLNAYIQKNMLNTNSNSTQPTETDIGTNTDLAQSTETDAGTNTNTIQSTETDVGTNTISITDIKPASN